MEHFSLNLFIIFYHSNNKLGFLIRVSDSNLDCRKESRCIKFKFHNQWSSKFDNLIG